MTPARQPASLVLEVDKLAMADASVQQCSPAPAPEEEPQVDNTPDLAIRPAHQKASYHQMMLFELRRRFDEIREKVLERFRVEFGPNLLRFREMIGQGVNLTSEPEIDELIEEVKKMATQYCRLSAEADAFRLSATAMNSKVRDLGGRFHSLSICEREAPEVQTQCYQLSAVLATMSSNGNNNHKDCLVEVVKGFADAFKNLSNTVMEDAITATRIYYTRRYELDAARYKLELLNESPSVSAYDKERIKADIEAKMKPYEEAKIAIKVILAKINLTSFQSKMSLMKEYRTQLIYQQSKTLHEALIRYYEANLQALKDSLVKVEVHHEQDQSMYSFTRYSEQA
uniref:AH domain-containing protein n=1 Tax=Steinernema glaseri TaxID=37863 RepID=A0A1I7YPH9_9BILA